MPGTMLWISYILTLLILKNFTLYPHFTDEETKAQRN